VLRYKGFEFTIKNRFFSGLYAEKKSLFLCDLCVSSKAGGEICFLIYPQSKA